MVEMLQLVAGAVVLVAVLLFALVRFAGGGESNTDAQRARDEAHQRALQRPPSDAAAKGERYTLVVQETQYDRVPPEVRGTINGLQTFVRDVPDPSGPDALRDGDSIRVQVTDHGTGGTSAQARFLERT